MMQGQKEACLFIGGPWDGRRLLVDPAAPFINAHPAEDSGVRAFDSFSRDEAPDREKQLRSVTYRRASLRAPSREWAVFVAEDAGGDEVIARLIAGYGGLAHPVVAMEDALRDLLKQIASCDGTAQIETGQAEQALLHRDL